MLTIIVFLIFFCCFVKCFGCKKTYAGQQCIQVTAQRWFLLLGVNIRVLKMLLLLLPLLLQMHVDVLLSLRRHFLLREGLPQEG